MAHYDIMSGISRKVKGNPKVQFSERGSPIVFVVRGVGLSGFEVKGFTETTGDEVLVLAGGTSEDTDIDVRKNDMALNGDLRFNIYHMAKCKWFYERNHNHTTHLHYIEYRERFMSLIKDINL